MDCPKSARTETGASLIEVLVAVFVSSIGLLGTASLLSVSAKANHSAYENTQAGLAAQALIDSMHANSAAVAAGGYDGAVDAATLAAIDCGKQICTPPQRAVDDRARFGRALFAALPNAKASLQCVDSAAASSGTSGATCRLAIGWSQRALVSTDKSGPQSLVWVFAP